MDNITHTLISVMVGETADRFTTATPAGLSAGTRRNLGLGLMIIGGNLPDADFLYSAITGNKLDYLLQHRGHTHTLVGALVIAGVMLLAIRAWSTWRRVEIAGRDWRYLAAIALVATLLHICLDFTNSYGVHPFWPVYNGWLYGDAVFIIEPLLWAAATPLLFTLRTGLARGLVGIILLAAIGISFFTGYVPVSLAAGLTLLIFLLASVGRYALPRTALLTGIGTWLAITAGFFLTGNIANARMDALLKKDFPAASTLDRVMTPMPVNPVCREVFAVQLEADQYVIRKAILSLLPEWLPAEDCPQVRGQDSTAPLLPVRATSTAEVAWLGEMAMPRTLVSDLSARYCAVRALLRFARVPWAITQGDEWIFGDLRYDREPGIGMAEIAVGEGMDDCPAIIPPWTPPRSDLLH